MWITPDYADFVTKNNLIWPITVDMIKKNMPNYTARLQKYGLTVEQVMAAPSNQYKGMNLSIPTQFGFASFPKLADNPTARQPMNDYYSLAFRDDVLKKVFPNALIRGAAPGQADQEREAHHPRPGG